MKDPLIGHQLANFRVDGILGHGGMATVYYGEDVKLQRPVAIKVIDKKYRDHPAYTKRFINEARMMAKWRHENIIQIYYADEEQGVLYYVMEYVDGHDLATVMDLYANQKELMPIVDVLRIGHAVSAALDYAHRQGVVHRDIKPSNILIAKDGRVLLGDFGMALEVRDGSLGNIFGTPHYISPEQARRSADAVPQSDLYSLGVILYEMLTGVVPFNDPSPASIALQHISEPPPPPRSINPLLSASVEAVLLKAIEKDPQNRYQSGAKLISALENAFKSTGSSQKTPLPPLPVGVPTVKRSELSIEQITNRKAPERVKANDGKKAAPLPPTIRSENSPRRKNGWIWILLLLLFFGFAGWYYLQNGLPEMEIPAPPMETPALLTPTDEPAQPTQAWTSTPALEPTVTFTPEVLPSPTLEATATPVPIVPTVKYPDGKHFTLFWNETSIHMMNRSREPRSFSAFVFQRLDPSGNPTDTFYGSRWENDNFVYLLGKYCVSIKIYGDEDPPYIDPSDCRGGYVSIVQPRKDEDRDQIFWSPKEDGSTQFRILFADEEVARCEIGEGICEFYVP